MEPEKDGLGGPLVPGLGEENIEAPLPYSASGEPTQRTRRNSSRGWLYATIILCCYGFFKEFKASEPFLTPYLVDFKNFTKNEVCISTYRYDSLKHESIKRLRVRHLASPCTIERLNRQVKRTQY